MIRHISLIETNIISFQAYDYVVERYEDTLYRYAEAIRERMSETSIAEAMEIKDRLVREFGCVSEVSYRSCSFL